MKRWTWIAMGLGTIGWCPLLVLYAVFILEKGQESTGAVCMGAFLVLGMMGSSILPWYFYRRSVARSMRVATFSLVALIFSWAIALGMI
jgi:hypothetical protein